MKAPLLMAVTGVAGAVTAAYCGRWLIFGACLYAVHVGVIVSLAIMRDQPPA
jgi:uncharacterized membrane protein